MQGELEQERRQCETLSQTVTQLEQEVRSREEKREELETELQLLRTQTGSDAEARQQLNHDLATATAEVARLDKVCLVIDGLLISDQ